MGLTWGYVPLTIVFVFPFYFLVKKLKLYTQMCYPVFDLSIIINLPRKVVHVYIHYNTRVQIYMYVDVPVDKLYYITFEFLFAISEIIARIAK